MLEGNGWLDRNSGHDKFLTARECLSLGLVDEISQSLDADAAKPEPPATVEKVYH